MQSAILYPESKERRDIHTTQSFLECSWLLWRKYSGWLQSRMKLISEWFWGPKATTFFVSWHHRTFSNQIYSRYYWHHWFLHPHLWCRNHGMHCSWCQGWRWGVGGIKTGMSVNRWGCRQMKTLIQQQQSCSWKTFSIQRNNRNNIMNNVITNNTKSKA